MYILYLLTFFGLCKCVSDWLSMGGKLLSGREGKGEVMSLEVAFKGGS